jgi:hypothetical protein
LESTQRAFFWVQSSVTLISEKMLFVWSPMLSLNFFHHHVQNSAYNNETVCSSTYTRKTIFIQQNSL